MRLSTRYFYLRKALACLRDAVAGPAPVITVNKAPAAAAVHPSELCNCTYADGSCARFAADRHHALDCDWIRVRCRTCLGSSMCQACLGDGTDGRTS